jgi:hypothetical protein
MSRTRSRTERAVEVAAALGQGVNGQFSYDDLADALTAEHPTLLGQIAKGVGTGVVRRSDYNPAWKPWDGFTRPLCTIERNVNYIDFTDASWEHPEHDGRLDCSTIVGAILMARQSYI